MITDTAKFHDMSTRSNSNIVASQLAKNSWLVGSLGFNGALNTN